MIRRSTNLYLTRPGRLHALAFGLGLVAAVPSLAVFAMRAVLQHDRALGWVWWVFWAILEGVVVLWAWLLSVGVLAIGVWLIDVGGNSRVRDVGCRALGHPRVWGWMTKFMLGLLGRAAAWLVGGLVGWRVLTSWWTPQLGVPNWGVAGMVAGPATGLLLVPYVALGAPGIWRTIREVAHLGGETARTPDAVRPRPWVQVLSFVILCVPVGLLVNTTLGYAEPPHLHGFSPTASRRLALRTAELTYTPYGATPTTPGTCIQYSLFAERPDGVLSRTHFRRRRPVLTLHR